MSRSDQLAAMESGMLNLGGLNNAIITTNKTLAPNETGFILVDATSAAVTITLPAASVPMDIRVQRIDNGGNRLVVQADGAERILFHTHLSATGYPFFVLMGAGDWWHLRSDGNGHWRPLSRMDSTPLGRPVFETTTAFSPGGWVGHNGSIYNRAEWPWVWDHAQASGMLTTEALRTGNEGKWTSGDGALTFRSPEGRGEFMRVLDESRGIDVSRAAGSWQQQDIQSHNHALAATSVINTAGGGAYWSGGSNGVSSAGPTAATGGTETRSRNIAYPGRLKMI